MRGEMDVELGMGQRSGGRRCWNRNEKAVILQGTIEAMSKLPKAAMDAANKNSTKPEEGKAADDKLYRYIKWIK